MLGTEIESSKDWNSYPRIRVLECTLGRYAACSVERQQVGLFTSFIPAF